jgi:hypothetical protein
MIYNATNDTYLIDTLVTITLRKHGSKFHQLANTSIKNDEYAVEIMLNHSRHDVYRGIFVAGEGNQLVAFQKTACRALQNKAMLALPYMFHCDVTTIDKDCNLNNTIRLEHLFVLSERIKRLITDAPPTHVIKSAFYQPNYCTSSGHSLQDIVKFSPIVVSYGTRLQRQCPNPCVVVQYRVGSDWVGHDKAHPGALISALQINKTVARIPSNHSCLLMTPEYVHSNIRCNRIHHDPLQHGSVRFFGELYVATQASMFFYNQYSTTIHIVRRLITHQVPSRRPKLIQLAPR